MIIKNTCHYVENPINTRKCIDGFKSSSAISPDGNYIVSKRQKPSIKNHIYELYHKQNNEWICVDIFQPQLTHDSGYYDISTPTFSGDGSVFAMQDVNYSVDKCTVTIFHKQDNTYIKRRLCGFDDSVRFGDTIKLSYDGKTLFVSGEQARDYLNLSYHVVYVFTNQNNEWIYTSTIHSPTNKPFDTFGSVIDISHNNKTLVIGTFNEYGMFYVFNLENNQYIHKASLTTSFDKYRGFFATNLVISGNGDTIAVMGEDSISDNESDTDELGFICLFQNTNQGWKETSLFQGEERPRNTFGWNIAISYNGDILIVGCSITFKDKYIYIFTKEDNNWVKHAKLASRIDVPNIRFSHIEVSKSTTDISILSHHKYIIID